MTISEIPEDADEAASQETAYLLSDPANAEFLRRGIAELDAGHVTEHELIQLDD